MLALLVLITVAFTAADHWTTYLCLRAPVEGWVVTEANPLANWMFGSIGLVPGILLDSGITVVALLFLLQTALLPRPVKLGFLGFVATWTGWAVVNNMAGLHALGLPLWGGLS
ncbi:MAG: hypothetical protein VX546_12325 [Myxococcota bacterium]|nr:hypothetical protein [Myxococcota bacterium]